jgi:ABC-type sulfate transport system substrate-binding protein
VRNWISKVVVGSILAGGLLATRPEDAAEVKILNVSYEVTREFYPEFNQAFAAHWKTKAGDTLSITQSHGGSSKQAQAVINGLEADVVTMNQPLDVDLLDRNVARHHTEAVARAYLEFRYSDEGQELAAKYHFRPKNQTVLARHADRCKPLDLFTVNEIAGG